MKKVIGILFLCFLTIATFSFAEETNEDIMVINSFDAEDVENLMQSEDSNIIFDDLYKMDQNVTITETIDGNVYVMAQSLKIESALIFGNLYVMAEEVEINDSNINGSIYVLGQKININCSTNDMYVYGNNVKFGTETKILRDMKIICSSLDFNGNVGRNIYANVGNIKLGNEAIVGGKLEYSSEKEIDNIDNSKIANVKYNEKNNEEKVVEDKVNIGEIIINILSLIFKTLIIVLMIVLLENNFNKIKRSDSIAKDFLKNTGKGFLFLILVPIISILFIISIIGTGLGFVIIALYIIALYFSVSIASIEIAKRILDKKQIEIKRTNLIGLSIGIVIVTKLLGYIPFIGSLIKFVIVLIGLGMTFSLIFQKVKKEEVINEN